MNFVYDDGGREAAGFKGAAGDCVVRAIAIAAQIPYREVYDALSEGCRNERKLKRRRGKSSARDGVYTQSKWFKDYMASIGWSWTPTMGIGTGCKVHLVAEELPPGRLIVHTARHSSPSLMASFMISGIAADQSGILFRTRTRLKAGQARGLARADLDS